ncbi:hypothetical protein ACM66B_005540 [Microbotryomycetes sp. NB124-2]
MDLVSASSSALAGVAKLDKPDEYARWSQKLRLYLEMHDLWSIVSGQEPEPPHDAALDEHRKHWHSRDMLAQWAIITTVSEPQQDLILHCKSSNDMWDTLEQWSHEFGPAKFADLFGELVSMRCTAMNRTKTHFNRMRDISHSLKEIGQPVTDNQLAVMMLQSLPPHWITVKTVVESVNAYNELPTSDQMAETIVGRIEEYRKSNKSGEHEAGEVQDGGGDQGEGSSEGKRSTRGGPPKCFNCGKIGHLSTNCRSPRKVGAGGRSNRNQQVQDGQQEATHVEVQVSPEENVTSVQVHESETV